jgi:hypothetical protein
MICPDIATLSVIIVCMVIYTLRRPWALYISHGELHTIYLNFKFLPKETPLQLKPPVLRCFVIFKIQQFLPPVLSLVSGTTARILIPGGVVLWRKFDWIVQPEMPTSLHYPACNATHKNCFLICIKCYGLLSVRVKLGLAVRRNNTIPCDWRLSQRL